jgi:hypothetical protein
VADSGSLWPGGTVYYQIVTGSGDQSNIATAISTFNSDFSGAVQWVNGTGSCERRSKNGPQSAA